MIIECENITAAYRPKISQILYNFKKYLQKQSTSPKIMFPLYNFSHTFDQGVHILIGPNSAGKSTLLYLLSGILRPASGTIRFDGQRIRPLELRRLISYLPQTFDLYPDFNAYEMLDYIALLKGITSKAHRKCAIEQALFETNLSPAAEQKIKTYSRGMKQRLGIAQTLLNHTPVLLLDEPTASLDPEERNKFRLLLTKLRQDRLVVFSSSLLTDAVCADTAVVLDRGCCRFAGTPASLAAYAKTGLTREENNTSFTANLQKGYRTVLTAVDAK